MKFFTNLFIASAFLLGMFSCTTRPIAFNPLDYVDPYIGSGEQAHVFVGASVPFGAVQIGPQNIHKGWKWCSGYHHSDSIVIGFSHTHLSGTGISDLGDVIVMPFSAEVRSKRGEQDNIEGSCAAKYSHDNEVVSPYYYSIKMDNDINVELTATERVAMHRYTYPTNIENHILINLKDGNEDTSCDTYLKKIDDYTVEGYRFSKGWSPLHKVFFVMRCSEPITKVSTFDGDVAVGEDEIQGAGVKGVLSFDNISTLTAKVAISSVSCTNALENLNAELSHWDFEETKEDARELWLAELSCIEVDSKDESSLVTFYTALYHTMIAPTTYCDVNGEFRGHDDKIYQADWHNYSTFSLWDTYRALHPLHTIIKPERVSDFVNSMLSIYDQQGQLPGWPLVGSETYCMMGNSAIPVIADAYLKGFDGFDAMRAFDAVKVTNTTPEYMGLGAYMKYGYIPCDLEGESNSKSMEYAIDDWGAALMADKLGLESDYHYFMDRAMSYREYFDERTNFITPKYSNGEWVEPYDPFNSIHGGKGYFCEGNGWQYTFFVPQNTEGLIELMGGDEPFIAKLDSLFIVDGYMGDEASMDITGLIGMYAHGNEPSHHVAYMYAYAGEQWKTARTVDYIQKNFYTTEIDGIIGNEDCGQTSAWHVISALGLYQVNPSVGLFTFGTPMFESATIKVANNKEFKIIANNISKDNIYIESATLNGEPYTKSYIGYNDIMAGGELVFVMSATPNKEFGKAKEDRPYSAKRISGLI